MPWKECHVVDERLRFIARLRDGETLSSGSLGRTLQLRDRYERCGLEALTDRQRRPRGRHERVRGRMSLAKGAVVVE